MSLLGLITRLQPSLGFLTPLTGPALADTIVRNASKKAGASTRNRCKHTPGKRRGIKVYDGQRVPHG